jgi:dipeptidyl-peptidase-4
MPLSFAVLLAGACQPPAARPCPRSGGSPVAASLPTSQQLARPTSGPAAGFLAQYAATYRFRLGHPKALKPTPKGDAVLFLRSPPRSFEHALWSFDPKTGKERRLLTAAQLLRGGKAAKLSAAEKARRERMRITRRGVARYLLSRDGEQLLVPLAGRLFLVARHSGAIRELGKREPKRGRRLDPRLSPDGKKLAYVRRGDLYVLEIASGRERRLTKRARPTLTYGLAEFVAQEEMRRFRGYWWSPDSKRLLVQQTDTKGVERLTIADPLHPERRPQRWAYPRAGKKNAIVRLALVSARGGPLRWLAWDSRRYPYLVRVRWQKGAPPTVVVQTRDQREMAVLACAEKRGKGCRVMHVERDAAWVEIDRQMPRWIRRGKAWLWTSERAGHRQLEVRDRGGKLLSVLVGPKLGYRRLVDYDGPRRSLVFAGGKKPIERQIYRVNLRSKKVTPLTRERGEHRGRFSKDHGLWVHRFAGLSGRRVTVHDRAGKRLGQLRSVAEAPSFAPRLQLLKVGKRRLAASVVRPRGYRKGQRYPVIVYVYAGPHYRTVRTVAHRYLLWQWIADHGFIVVSIDGRGTPNRGRAWEKAIKGSFHRVPLADQVAGLKALGARLPELDLARVGVFGWSYGGYMAVMAVLRRPDVFHAAVAGAPVTEWRDYDTHYTERYGGLLPQNAKGYDADSALKHAHRLRRPLLVVHGTADDNVYFFHSVKLARAMFLAGRPFELLPLAGFTHVVPDPNVMRRLYGRIIGHFRTHLSAKKVALSAATASRDQRQR